MHEAAVSPVLLKLLHELLSLDEISDFALGGGTSLALRFGHRTSVDLDWFIETSFDAGSLQNALRRHYGDLQVVNRTVGRLCCVAHGVKLDFLHHAYPRLQPLDVLAGCRMVSLVDLAAMKINAITNRGSKKDFCDLLLLHESGNIPLSRALEYFCSKYGETGRALALRSLIWFMDADDEPDPVYLNGWTWAQIRRAMNGLVQKLCQEAGL
jgi:hypothetical protein